MKLLFYTLLLIFSIGAIISECTHDFKSFKLISYSQSPNKFIKKDRLYYTYRLSSDHSSGSQGIWIFYGNIKSSGKEGNISGWIKTMESKWHFDKNSEQYYFNIWYCPKLDVIMEIIEGDINDPKNKSFNGWMIQSWFRAIMFIMSVPFAIIIYKIKKLKNEI